VSKFVILSLFFVHATGHSESIDTLSIEVSLYEAVETFLYFGRYCSFQYCWYNIFL